VAGRSMGTEFVTGLTDNWVAGLQPVAYEMRDRNGAIHCPLCHALIGDCSHRIALTVRARASFCLNTPSSAMRCNSPASSGSGS
jgi:hypothetical protein